MGFYSMPRYFEHMPQVGKPMKKANPENEAQLKAIEAEIHELIKAAQSAGRSDESLALKSTVSLPLLARLLVMTTAPFAASEP